MACHPHEELLGDTNSVFFILSLKEWILTSQHLPNFKHDPQNKQSTVPWWSWLSLSFLEPDRDGGLTKGGGVGGTNRELLRLRPGKHAYIHSTDQWGHVYECVFFIMHCQCDLLCLFVAIWLCSLTLLSIVSIGITGHASRQPPSQTGTLCFSGLVFHILSIPDDIVLPLQLGHH